MAYLNTLVGFSFIMLVFAIGVSTAQVTLTRLLRLKGKAVLGYLLEELEARWRQSDLPEKAFAGIAAALTTHLTAHRSKHARTMRASPVGDPQVMCALLRRFGKEELPRLLASWGDAHPDLDSRWEQIVQGIEHSWDSMAPIISASYTGNTKRYMLGLSVVTVLLFNVDVIRIVRILTVDPDVRAALVADAARVAAALSAQPAQPPGATSAPAPGSVGDTLAQLTEWQRHNVEELKAAGLPLGWEVAPLWVCEGGAPATYRRRCSGPLSIWDTALLWLVSAFGLAIGAGLVSQGAPFWFKLLQKELGLGRAASPPTPPPPPSAPRLPSTQPPRPADIPAEAAPGRRDPDGS